MYNGDEVNENRTPTDIGDTIHEPTSNNGNNVDDNQSTIENVDTDDEENQSPTEDKRKEIRICNRHQVDKIEKTIKYLDTKKRKQTGRALMYVPNICVDSGRINRGLGSDRMLARQQQDNILTPNMSNNNNNQDVPTSFGNPFGYKIMDNVDDGFGNNKKTTTREKERIVVRFCELNDVIIKTITGFSSLAAMMGFIVIACNGEYETMKSTCTQLTWLEEWLVYFESLWGKSSQRWVDLQCKYKASPRRLRKIFYTKTAMVKECATIRWP
jgi:hypothetical protein